MAALDPRTMEALAAKRTAESVPSGAAHEQREEAISGLQG